MLNIAQESTKLPPMLLQYLEYKGRYPDALLFFQVGDFYELFFDDAITVSRVLNLTLTSRDKNAENPVPMCGVPIGAIEGYIDRLLAQRFSVALVSQKEVREGQKGPVERTLDRIVTPGIQILSHSQGGRGAAFVAALSLDSLNEISLAYSEVQSGRILIRDGFDLRRLIAELQRIGPAELIVPASQGALKVDRRQGWVRELEMQLSETSIRFRNERPLENDGDRSIVLAKVPGYSSQSPISKRAVRLLTDYVEEVTVGAGVPLTEISAESDDGSLLIDSMTRTNLEIVRNNRDGGLDGSLYKLLDCTVTDGGSKVLRQWLLAPLARRDAIIDRQHAVCALKNSIQRKSLRALLSRMVDSERIAVRIDLNVVTPRELGALRDALGAYPEIRELLDNIAQSNDSKLLGEFSQTLDELPELLSELDRTLRDDLPLAVNQGGIIREGFDASLDQLNGVMKKGRSWIEELEQSEKERTGISSLKIKYTSVFGYFIEVTNANLSRVPETYIRKQTTANSERFFTEELKRRELEILGADERAIQKERALFDDLRALIGKFCAVLRRNARIFNQLDALSALAEIADREGYVAPAIVDSDELEIIDGCHPVLLSLLQNQFIPNSVRMGCDAKRCFIVTGPNMGGKSTYLRQTALIVILAQIGSFVPAARATIGVVDRVFARIGASDNLREGESTFMVEMREASSIIASAQARSLVLIDEIGRGTATLDGLALAQAILEWMVVKSCARVLFATHFHELTLLENIYPSVKNVSVGSEDRGKSIVFTHRIVDGAANRSYGLEVAERAGLPGALMRRARALHAELVEKEEASQESSPQLSLFNPQAVAAAEHVPARNLDPIREKLAAMRIDSMTPLAALTALAELVQLVEQEAP